MSMLISAGLRVEWVSPEYESNGGGGGAASCSYTHIDSFCTMSEPRGTDLLSCTALLFPAYTEISASRLLCLLPTSRRLLAWLILRPWRWRRRVPPLSLTFNGIYGITSISRKVWLLKSEEEYSRNSSIQRSSWKTNSCTAILTFYETRNVIAVFTRDHH
jgi:hypothetical protein